MADAISATAAMDTAGSETAGLVTPSWPLSKRIKYSIVAFLYNTLLLKPMLLSMSLKKYFSSPSEKDPDLVKRYPIRKSLTIRIFFPPSHRDNNNNTTNNTSSPTTTNAKLPTLLTIHGGGFTVGQPHDNDGWNRTFSQRHGFLVIALDYTKAPTGPFPTAIHDIEALISCILSDPSLLPLIDADRVALAGWSAGGNLALAVSQLPSLRGRVGAAVPLYPVLDMVTPRDVKARARRYKPGLSGFRGRDRDYLLVMMSLFNWAYLKPGQRCDDPLLSPIYAPRDCLPKSVFVVACEMDLLAPEAWRMACRLAGKRVPGLDEVVGCEEPVGKGVLITEGDERFAWEQTSGDSRVRWLLVPDTIHGFDQDLIASVVRDPVTMEDARIKTAKTIDLIGEWLLEGPLRVSA
ncbi:alpha/beta-hydrolase [Parathielavia hyrcaniae]|uniref:Alpha/beta-hydrolase n=1 Tax=Parathielavia hyrcaniae TaxID=113614 RepID=A0AAN6SY44_9PEZI|nr:alpha/beta-hydrolase [Parathielavia hyrcaniae]